MRRLLLAIFALFFLIILFFTIRASLSENILAIDPLVLSNRWFQATLVDAYLGFLTFYVWVFYRERSWVCRGLWLSGDSSAWQPRDVRVCCVAADLASGRCRLGRAARKAGARRKAILQRIAPPATRHDALTCTQYHCRVCLHRLYGRLDRCRGGGSQLRRGADRTANAYDHPAACRSRRRMGSGTELACGRVASRPDARSRL